MKKIAVISAYLIGIIILIWIYKSFDIVNIKSYSMYPNFKNGDKLLVFKSNKKLKENDVVVFRHKNNSKLIKRITSSPKSKYIYTNTNSRFSLQPIDKDFFKLKIPQKNTELKTCLDIKRYKSFIENETRKNLNIRDNICYLGNKKIERYIFSENFYFVEGDNKEESIDSRLFGMITEKSIIGKVIYKL